MMGKEEEITKAGKIPKDLNTKIPKIDGSRLIAIFPLVLTLIS